MPPDDSQQDEVDGLALGTRGGLRFRHNFPQDAEYELAIGLLRNFHGYLTGLEFAHRVEIAIDGEQVFVAQVGGEEDNLASDRNMSATARRDRRAPEDPRPRRGRSARRWASPSSAGIAPSRTSRCSSTSAITICRT